MRSNSILIKNLNTQLTHRVGCPLCQNCIHSPAATLGTQLIVVRIFKMPVSVIEWSYTSVAWWPTVSNGLISNEQTQKKSQC